MSADQEGLKKQANELCERYAKPLEAQHRGEYVAVSTTGNTILGSTMREVLKAAAVAFGPGNFIFKVGEKAVGRWL